MEVPHAHKQNEQHVHYMHMVAYAYACRVISNDLCVKQYDLDSEKYIGLKLYLFMFNC